MNRIRERRQTLGMRQKELSDILRASDPRIDMGMISRFECGVCLPTASVLSALETALQTSRRELFTADDLTAAAEIDGTEEAQTRGKHTKLLESAIPEGRENAISRRELAQQIGLTDRKLRSAIAQARSEGVFILNTQNGDGYFRSNNADDLLEQYRRDMGRAMAILTRCEPLKRYLETIGACMK